MPESHRVDPRSADFEVAVLDGSERLYCSECNDDFDLAYADAVMNNDASWPPKACCKLMMKAVLEKNYRHIASQMVVSDSPALRKGGVDLRNAMGPKAPEE